MWWARLEIRGRQFHLAHASFEVFNWPFPELAEWTTGYMQCTASCSVGPTSVISACWRLKHYDANNGRARDSNQRPVDWKRMCYVPLGLCHSASLLGWLYGNIIISAIISSAYHHREWRGGEWSIKAWETPLYISRENSGSDWDDFIDNENKTVGWEIGLIEESTIDDGWLVSTLAPSLTATPPLPAHFRSDRKQQSEKSMNRQWMTSVDRKCMKLEVDFL